MEKRVSSPSPRALDAIVRAARRLARKNRVSPSAVERWTRALLGTAPRTVLEDRDPSEMARVATAAFQEFRSPRRNDTVVRVSGDFLTVIQDDRPFLVRTLLEWLRATGVRVRFVLHPVLRCERDRRGAFVRFSDRENSLAESFILVVVESGTLPRAAAAEIRTLMDLVRRVVDDFPQMQQRLNETILYLVQKEGEYPSEELTEARNFLRWLLDGNFVLLGARSYRVEGAGRKASLILQKGSGLGVLADDATSRFRRPVPFERIRDAEFRLFLEQGPMLRIGKGEFTTAIYRGGRADAISVRITDRRGRVTGVHRFYGHFSDRANTIAKVEVPILRLKFQRIQEAFRAERGSFDEREIAHLFSASPVDTLLLTPTADLVREFELSIRRAGDDGVQLALSRDPVRHGVNVILVMPQARYQPAMIKSVERAAHDLLCATHVDARIIADSSEGGLVRLHFFFETRKTEIDREELQARILAAVRSWKEQVLEELEQRLGARAAQALTAIAPGLDDAYRALVPPAAAADDIADLESVRDGITVRWGSAPDADGCSILKIFSPGRRLILSEVAPVLVHFAFTIQDENSFELTRDGRPVHLHIFRVRSGRRAFSNDAIGVNVSACLTAALEGRIEHDTLSALVTTAGLLDTEVDLLRCIRNYSRQIAALPARKGANTALVNHPEAARLLVHIFTDRFSPGSRGRKAKALRRQFESYLARVSSLDDDRALRAFFNVIDSTVRTNYFVPSASTIALKIDCSRIARMPAPRPWREITVYGGTSMEGCHLRGGPVARGGIRWSERPDDFRTEILGLMKTQITKNAQIVPTGAKGGFIVKRLPADRSAVGEEVRRCYRLLISGMLDMQDTLDRNGKVVRPNDVVAYDGDDPYLVVAADKGTATFSDTANALSIEYGHWLDDAFASGGSNGYDHKVEGITARGAWVSVLRHFRDRGIDIRRTPFTVVGVGDMSGDVFGNGMLLSNQIRLLAAFDHRDIFLDPDPDPARSFQERKRLFALPRSSWRDVDPRSISTGGGVFPRTMKSIPLSEPVRRALGVAATALDPDSLIRAILCAPVDLLYNGGIGTYVKASFEVNSEVGDPQNDALRVDATQLRAGIVGEGGNLGFTQAARIEFAQRGGRIFTDAMDNSAGVDLSDHEVNLKILIDGCGRKISANERTRLLRRFKGSIIRDVLRDNYEQTLAVSLDRIRSQRRVTTFARTMADLEKRGLLNSALEGLPDPDTLKEREAAGQGMAPPELAVLLSYAKLDIKARLMDSPIVSNPQMQGFAEKYFAADVRSHFGKSLLGHRLRSHILVTVLSNAIVNLHGATVLHRLTTELGLAASRVAEGLLAAREILALDRILEGLFALDGRLPSERQYAEILAAEEATVLTARWLARNVHELRGRFTETVAEYNDLHGRILPVLRAVLPADERRRFDEAIRARTEAGIGKDLAERLALLDHVPTILDAVQLAGQKRRPLRRAAETLYEVGDRLRLGTLVEHIRSLTARSDWDSSAATDVVAELRRSRRRIAERLVDLGVSIDAYLKERYRSAATLQAAIARIESEKPESMSPFIVISNQIQNLAAL